MTADTWHEEFCPLCGMIARRRYTELAKYEGEVLSCAVCGFVTPIAEVERRVARRVERFRDAHPRLVERGPDTEERRVRRVADHLLSRQVHPGLAAELVELWSQRRVPAVPVQRVRILTDEVAGALLQRLAA